jgi:guanyl-specific ribonuclease Sa
MNTIVQGNSAEIATLNPHTYNNIPHRDTGAILPYSASGYTAFDVPIGRGTGKRGDGRLIIDNATGAAYFTDKHYKSFYPCNFPPIQLRIP